MKLALVTILLTFSGSLINAADKVSDIYLPWCKTDQNPKKHLCRDGSSSGAMISETIKTDDTEDSTKPKHRGSGRDKA